LKSVELLNERVEGEWAGFAGTGRKEGNSEGGGGL